MISLLINSTQQQKLKLYISSLSLPLKGTTIQTAVIHVHYDITSKQQPLTAAELELLQRSVGFRESERGSC